jgi:SAM-dependent methyltransferase
MATELQATTIESDRDPGEGNWSPQKAGVYDGVASSATDATIIEASAGATVALNVREYYDDKGWKADDKGVFDDTRAFLDTREASLEYTHKCISRLNKYFKSGGRYLVDAGSGPIAHRAYLDYSEHFAHRVCVDFSLPALRIARSRLGDSGIYIQGDLTNIPIKTGSIDAITCNHVIYHIPAEKQSAVFRELWRIMRPGGVAVIVYAWPWAPIAGALRRVAKMLAGDGRPAQITRPDLYFFAHSLNWFRSQEWPFRYKLDTFRIIDNDFMMKYIGDGWFGQAMLRCFYGLQVLLPGFCGKFGAYPAIVIYKD